MALVAEFERIMCGITDSDVELIKCLCLPNKTIASTLSIPSTAIGMKLARLAIKMKVENRTTIVIKALKLGIITIDQLVYREFDGDTD